MMNIVCWWWGSWPRGLDYVLRLRNMLSRNLTMPYKFICLTDKHVEPTEGVEFRVVPEYLNDFPYNLRKLFVFSEESGLSGRVIEIDLDSVIVGNLDGMFSYSGPFCAIHPLRYADEKGDMKHPWYGGGLISFQHEDFRWIWARVKDHPQWWAKHSEGGKERLVFRELFKNNTQDFWNRPRNPQFASFKRHVRRAMNLPDELRFIAFHGSPRPHEVEHLPWMKEHWR